ncbi:hypothetical protein Plhal304r1_c090g0171171 [Plasmopara halstedii]
MYTVTPSLTHCDKINLETWLTLPDVPHAPKVSRIISLNDKKGFLSRYASRRQNLFQQTFSTHQPIRDAQSFYRILMN